jgi:hypothetical protein
MTRLHLAFGLAVAVSAVGLQAQVPLEANIPFEFRMGQTSFPSGDYVFQYTTQMVTVQERDGHRSTAMAMMLPVSRSKAPETNVLQFHRYGDVYFLSGIFLAGSPEGAGLPKSAHEKELAKLTKPRDLEVALRTK